MPIHTTTDIAENAFQGTNGLQDIYCHLEPGSGDVSWFPNPYNFIQDPLNSTNFHVDYIEVWNYPIPEGNVYYVGDLGAAYDEVTVSEAGVATYCIP